MTWQLLHLQCTKSQTELAEALLLEEGAVSIVLEDAGDEPLFEPLPGESPLWSQVVVSAYFEEGFHQDFKSIASTIAAQIGASRFWLSSLEDKDWTREWMSHYRPIRLREDFWIVPEWLEIPNAHATNILLDPGLAFGTGYHATTRLCLDWLYDEQPSNKTVLDYGCGSGILGVGALLLGAKQVLAVDIDPQAILATQQNATRNGVGDKITAYLPEAFEKIQASPIHIITANILAKPLIALAPLFGEILDNGGRIVLAGLIQSQVEAVLAAYSPYFDMDSPFVYDNNDDGHWVRLSGTKH